MSKKLFIALILAVISQVSQAQTKETKFFVMTPEQMQRLVSSDPSESSPTRRWPYGDHDRFMMTLALQNHYKNQVTDIHYGGSWHIMHNVINAESYLQFLGDGIANLKDSWETSFIMNQWRRFIDVSATVVNSVDRAYLAIYSVKFKVKSEEFNCYAFVTKVGHKASPNKKDVFRIELKSCNAKTWDLEEKVTFDKLVEGL